MREAEVKETKTGKAAVKRISQFYKVLALCPVGSTVPCRKFDEGCKDHGHIHSRNKKCFAQGRKPLF